jgi:galactokinase/mevalonate kinase-like predicted kinase
LTPGIKILRTRVGSNQVPSVTRVEPSPRFLRELRERGLLYYTGQRRLARGILRGVVRRYLSGDRAVTTIIRDLKSAAEDLANDVSRGALDGFARGLLRNWELKKAIDPGATDARIEAILSELTPHLSGYELPGAGGGGFVFMIARTSRDARRVRTIVEQRRITNGARFYDFAIDQRGLTVTVE